MSKFRTYYNADSYRDKPIEFDPNSSLTDQDYKMHTEVEYLLAHMAGQSRTPLYGVQDNSTFEDWQNEMALVKRRFLNLTPDMQKEFGNAKNFLAWCSDPNNYAEDLPTVKAYREKQQLAKQKELEKQQLEQK